MTYVRTTHVSRSRENRLTAAAVDLSTVSSADRARLAKLYTAYGKKMIPMHERWHQANGSGGTQGPGSGEKFMQFHANLMKDFVAALKKKDPALLQRLGGQIPSWDTTKALPEEFWFKDMLPSAKGPKGIDWQVPGYLTVAGGGDPFVLSDVTPPRTIRSLNDIKTADELGRVLGQSGAHAVGHVRLGGQMNTFKSVGAAPFLLWHGKMEELRAAWLQMPSGRAAAAAHPPQGWLDNDANGHEMHMGGTKGVGAPRFTQRQVQAELARLARQQR